MGDWVVFDLDETVIDHDTFGRFLAHLLRRNTARAAAALLVLPLVGPLIATRRFKARGASVLVWIATVGVSDDSLGKLVQGYVAELGTISRCYREALSEIGAQLKAGHKVAVVTASAEILARPLCHEIDPRLVVVGSRLKRIAGGLVAAEHCYGENKVAPVHALRGPVRAAYSDSASDLPMLRLAEEVVLVNASPGVERKVRRALEDRPLRLVTWSTALAD